MSRNYILDEQSQLDLIQFWLSRTTELFDDWDFNGKELSLIKNNRVIEFYDEETVINILRESDETA